VAEPFSLLGEKTIPEGPDEGSRRPTGAKTLTTTIPLRRRDPSSVGFAATFSRKREKGSANRLSRSRVERPRLYDVTAPS